MKYLSSSLDCLRCELKLRNIGFRHNQLDEFYRSKWQSEKTCVWFLLYRWLWFLIFLTIFLLCICNQFADGKYFIFFTNWGIVVCVITQLLAVILATQWHFNFQDVRSTISEVSQTLRTPKIVGLYWMLHNVTMVVASVISFIYWLFLHGKMDKPIRYPELTFITHCLNLVFMLVDYFIVAFPVRLMHTIYAMLFTISFFGFSGIYYLCGGTDDYGHHYVYPFLDWTTPVKCVRAFFGIFFLHCMCSVLLFGLYQVKRFLHKIYRGDVRRNDDGLI
uniref:Uncharacterized protein n=1 Tax=Musca domestica TaxID=7370 RepID=A0A1I8M350_MUSDO